MTFPNTPPTGAPRDTADEFTSSLLAAVFSKLSQSISGPDRILTGEESVASFLPEETRRDALDPDIVPDQMDPFLPDFTEAIKATLPDFSERMDAISPRSFDASTLPSPEQGKFYNTPKGLIRYSIGVGEAPDNKANTNHPSFQERAEFMGGVYSWVLSNFDATPEGHFRDHDAPVTANRSPNSDHYSGGAFDVRASSPSEARRVLTWAAQQPWVSFAQIYPDGHLVHISANIAAFAGPTPVPFTTGLGRTPPLVQPDPGVRSASKPQYNPLPEPPRSTPPPTPIPIHRPGGGPQEF